MGNFSVAEGGASIQATPSVVPQKVPADQRTWVQQEVVGAHVMVLPGTLLKGPRGGS